MSCLLPYPGPLENPPPSVTVENIAEPKYSHKQPGAFAHFGFPVQLVRGIDKSKSKDELAALLQSWLYFGLIEEILNESVDSRNLAIKDSTSQRTKEEFDVLGARWLGKQMCDRRDDINRLDKAHRDRLTGYIRNSIKFAEDTLELFDQVKAEADSNLACVALSIRLLLCYLRRFWDVNDGQLLPFSLTQPMETPLSARILLDRLAEGGMHPRRVQITATDLDYLSLYYLSSLRPTTRSRQRESSKRRSRKNAKERDEKDKAYHREGCSCDDKIKPDMIQVDQIIRDEGIPLISIDRNDGKIELRVVKHSYSRRYVAISHVWGDKQLCSDDENALYRCQLEHLAEVLEKMPSALQPSELFLRCAHTFLARCAPCIIPPPKDERLFWLDTLCIPKKPVRSVSNDETAGKNTSEGGSETGSSDKPENSEERDSGDGYDSSDEHASSGEPECGVSFASNDGLESNDNPERKDSLMSNDDAATKEAGTSNNSPVETSSRRNKKRSTSKQSHPLRQHAIDTMDLIYASASEVLVLDRELQLIRCSKVDNIIVPSGEAYLTSSGISYSLPVPHYDELLDIAGKIFCSNWMSRAWTLQEGTLARSCVIQLENCTIRLENLDFRRYNRSLWTAVWVKWPFSLLPLIFSRSHTARISLRERAQAILFSVVAIIGWPLVPLHSIYRTYHPITIPPPSTKEMIFDRIARGIRSRLDRSILESSSYSQGKKFVNIWNSLVSRRTAEPNDIHFIIANLVGFKAAKLAEMNESDEEMNDSDKDMIAGRRMRAILFSLDQIPFDVLFLKTKKYLSGNDDPDRWIPLRPDDKPLDARGYMEYQKDGFKLPAGAGLQYRIVYVRHLPGYAKLPTKFKLNLGYYIWSQKVGMSQVLAVNCLSPQNDNLKSYAVEDTYIVLPASMDEGLDTFRGARFKRCGQMENKKVELQYDCALEFSREELSDELPMFEVEKPRDTLTFYMKHSWGETSNRHMLERRPADTSRRDDAGVTPVAVLSAAVTLLSLTQPSSFTGIWWGASNQWGVLRYCWWYFCAMPLPYFVARYCFNTIGFAAWKSTFAREKKGSKGSNTYWWLWWWIHNVIERRIQIVFSALGRDCSLS